ncbi:prepilin-type N-terminal cleavage/methylation domain-containing protein [Alkalicoccus halolimnae]|uniref:Prepilin-type N-terminal cleavage/methylation domain-containing protein n=1 Tax=Alkalicoccus halolimnae TaxID=1667239 RepID=A0A5C7F5D8_9BACI|nr:prepilin-type N-terminal cleavage/methylation domain-containing protein [Alkalicoccus halolimnae]TXF85832.1 prepilin-type N-terminal cleavage/methylation domain-containing protein [Alkalicoccus halolimnae]
MRKIVKNIRQYVKNQKGLTLVELLAVIVILGIIAAIAIPSVSGIIDNSRQDAHIANAEAMVSSARLATISENADAGTRFDALSDATEGEINLVSADYLEAELEDPDGDAYENAYVVSGEDGEYRVTLNNGDNIFSSVTISNIREDGREAIGTSSTEE